MTSRIQFATRDHLRDSSANTGKGNMMLKTGVFAQQRPQSILILIGIWFSTQFVGIFSPPLMDDVDGIHVEAAKEMVLRHDYVTLYVDGIRYLDKPPLPYWLGAAGIHLFGFHDWAVRLPLAISVLLLTLYLYSMGRRLFGDRAGFYSACAFATAIGPYIYTRFFIPDVIVALWMTITADLILLMVYGVRGGVANPFRQFSSGWCAQQLCLQKVLSESYSRLAYCCFTCSSPAAANTCQNAPRSSLQVFSLLPCPGTSWLLFETPLRVNPVDGFGSTSSMSRSIVTLTSEFLGITTRFRWRHSGYCS